MSYFEEMIAHVKSQKTEAHTDSPWHTGTPTEEGWYVLHYPKCKEKPLELAKWNGSKFVAVEPFHAIIVYIEADTVPLWQKIEDEDSK